MGMLDSFNNIPKGYVPHNTNKNGLRRKQIKTQPPYQKSPNSFWWNQGDQFVFIYRPQLMIRVESSAIILEDDTSLLSSTVGFRGQKAYDIVNLVSYTYKAGYNNEEGWEQDKIFSIPVSGPQEVMLRNIPWENVTITFEIKNFRHETIYKYPTSPDDIPLVVDSDDAIELTIGTILSELLKYGSYQFVFILNGANEYAPIYTQNIFDISIVQKRVSNNRESISNGEEEDDYDIHLILDGGEESLMGIDCDCLFGQ